MAGALLAAASPTYALNRGQQWFVDNGLQITGVIGDPGRGMPFHLSTYQSMGYTTEVWEWVSDPSQLTMSWGRWVTQVSNLPPVGSESAHLATLKQLNLGTPGGDEADLNDPNVRNQQVAFFNSAHANSSLNNVLLWNNNYGGQVNDASLGDFISRAQPDMISFDTYPYAPGSQPGGGSPTNWYGDFRRYRQWGMDTNTPVGFYRQTYASPTGVPQTREISQSELSLQTFAGLAFNAKFISDFTYNFNGNTMFSGGGDNTITPLGTAAQTINAEVKRLGPALVRLKPVVDQTTPNYTSSMMFIRGKNTNASTYNAIPIGFVADPQNNAYTDWVQGRNDPYMLEPTAASNLGSTNNHLPGDVIISWFRVMDETFDGAFANEKYFMITNGLADMNATAAQTQQNVTLNFNFAASGITQLQRLSRSTGQVEDVNLTPLGGSNYSLSLTLDGGRGDLFKFKDGAPFVGIDAIPATVYWDSDGNAANNNTGTGAGLGGNGNWDASAKWFDGASEVSWSGGGSGVFYGTAGTVVLASPQFVGGLSFKTSGYVVTGSTMTMIGPSISVDAGVTATISSDLAGASGLTKSGAGTLNLAGVNTYSGGTSITAGVLGISSSTSLGAVPSSPGINLAISNGAALRFNADGITLPVNRQILLSIGGGVFDTNGNNATIAGAISGLGLTKIGAGTLVLASSSNSYAGATNVSAGKLVFTSNLTSSASLTVQDSATAEVAQNGNRVIKTPALSVVGSGQLNLTDNKLITPSAIGSWNGSAYTGVTGLIASGRNNTNWNGFGIITTMSAAAGTNYTSIGVAKGVEVKSATQSMTATWAGQTITGTDTLVMYTYGGDANLDGKINIDDYVRIDAGLAGGLSGWSNGDFNYDGKVNIDDYTTIIDANIGNQAGVFPTSSGGPASGGSGSISAVPEPASLTMLTGLAAVLIARRRRGPQS